LRFCSVNSRVHEKVLKMDLLEIYLLNLMVSVGMFIVLIFRAWVEMKNYKILWREREWIRTKETARRILVAEKSLFEEVEGGRELYELLCELFDARET